MRDKHTDTKSNDRDCGNTQNDECHIARFRGFATIAIPRIRACRALMAHGCSPLLCGAVGPPRRGKATNFSSLLRSHGRPRGRTSGCDPAGLDIHVAKRAATLRCRCKALGIQRSRAWRDRCVETDHARVGWRVVDEVAQRGGAANDDRRCSRDGDPFPLCPDRVLEATHGQHAGCFGPRCRHFSPPSSSR